MYYQGPVMSILSILDQINSSTKRSHKLGLIEQHKDNELFMRVVKLALDPYINFFIKKIPAFECKNEQSLEWALDQLELLSSRKVTGNAGIEHLRKVLSSLNKDDATVVSRIIGKDLRCGMADGIVNAVVKDYIPTYPCLLARAYDDKNIKNIEFPALSQLKADGLRVNFHISKDSVYICGRSGREIDLLGQMDEDSIRLASRFAEPVVVDGELVVVDDQNRILPRKIGNGIINKAIKGTISKEEAAMVRAKVWDVVTSCEFKAGLSKTHYRKRFQQIQDAVQSLKTDADSLAKTLAGNNFKFWIIESKEVSSLEEAQDHFSEMLSRGEEGTILKNFCGQWEDSRSKHLVKLKAEKDCDLFITGFNPGTGKFEGLVGSLICESSDGKVVVSISGFDDALRKEISDNIEGLVGTVVSVMYNERIKSKTRTDVDSLFLPRFLEFRNDKTEANSSSEIL